MTNTHHDETDAIDDHGALLGAVQVILAIIVAPPEATICSFIIVTKGPVREKTTSHEDVGPDNENEAQSRIVG